MKFALKSKISFKNLNELYSKQCVSLFMMENGFTLFWFATSHIFICRHVDGLMLISRSAVEVSIDPLQLIFAITYNNTQYKNYVHVLAIGRSRCSRCNLRKKSNHLHWRLLVSWPAACMVACTNRCMHQVSVSSTYLPTCPEKCASTLYVVRNRRAWLGRRKRNAGLELMRVRVKLNHLSALTLGTGTKFSTFNLRSSRLGTVSFVTLYLCFSTVTAGWWLCTSSHLSCTN